MDDQGNFTTEKSHQLALEGLSGKLCNVTFSYGCSNMIPVSEKKDRLAVSTFPVFVLS